MRPLKIMIFLVVFSVLFGSIAHSESSQFFKAEFKDRDGCFLLVDIKNGAVLDQFNAKRCDKRFAPMSTFKIPLVVMAFDSQYFRTSSDAIKWDGKKRRRESVNRDQTPKTFISNSVIWVSRRIVHFLGAPKVKDYLDQFNYGNKSVSKDLDNFWLTEGSVKISAKEQVKFLSSLWQNKLSVHKEALRLTKEATFDRVINDKKIYGKTGTGCIDKGCMPKPGRELGWFVGFVEDGGKTYAFALNFSELKSIEGYAGLAAKKIAHKYFKSQFPEKL